MVRFGSPPNDLQMIVLPTISNDECKERGDNVGDGQLCTFSRFGQGACGVSVFYNLIIFILNETSLILNKSIFVGRFRWSVGARRILGRRCVLWYPIVWHWRTGCLHSSIDLLLLDHG